ncbi:hypothetical protein HNP48_002715 [Acidovorax soli]|uniref:IrrE N-terminal-like domain-containing protein n=1 Tax=Acidovorax soli TaxID=592050 RepID=A0A7X0PDR9_9BURK|nr:ImmA/IrrE family metallo-endopeptidase [Acidovorax soli]MBB6560043.1 hypothetical protein [Acidovorax soli]
MANIEDKLVNKLLGIGLPQTLVDASIPDWWVPEDNDSLSARTLASLLLARRLNLDPQTLLDDGVPVGFLHTGPTKFKHMRLAEGPRRDALVGFSMGVGRILLSMLDSSSTRPVPADPLALRRALMFGRPFVSFGDVIAACWSLGVPVLHLRLFPAQTKGVTAIAVRLGERHAILVARESGLDAQYMFHVAHELGHIALGHLNGAGAIIDADPYDPANHVDELIDDDEERAADEYAQALLTGQHSFSVMRGHGESSHNSVGTARELASHAMQTGQRLNIDPGHIVMSFGYSTREWPLAFAAAKLLPQQEEKPATLVNRILWQQLTTTGDDAQALAYLKAVATI